MSMETGRAQPELGSLRAEIERVDDALVQLIAERCRIASSVGEAKRRSGLPLFDPAREAAVVRRETLSILADTLARLKVREALPRLAQLMRAPNASNGDLDWNIAGAIGEISGEDFGEGRGRVAAADNWLRSKGY